MNPRYKTRLKMFKSLFEFINRIKAPTDVGIRHCPKRKTMNRKKPDDDEIERYPVNYGVALKYKDALDENSEWSHHSYTTCAYSAKEAEASMQTPDVTCSAVEIRLIAVEVIK